MSVSVILPREEVKEEVEAEVQVQVVPDLTVVNRLRDAEILLEVCQKNLKYIPKKIIPHGNFGDTHKLAEKIDQFLKNSK